MKNNSLLLAIFTIAISSSISLHAQSLSTRQLPKSATRSHLNEGGLNRFSGQGSGNALGSNGGAPILPLSSAVAIPGAVTMPVWGLLDEQQSDGRALHNIQVDPSNPKNVHAIIMEETGTNAKDTNLFNRRLLYTFSADGGQTWSNPDTLGNTRDGFASMILYKRAGNYVPIIAAHQYLTNLASSLVQSVIWIEQGTPGEGNFARDTCGTTYNNQGSPGTGDILWPYIAVSPDNTKIYIVGSFDNPNSGSAVDYINFGTFSLSEAGTATFDGDAWAQQIGDTNQNDGNAGYDQSGDYVMRVSPSGKIGLLWRETDYGDQAVNLYFIESTDGGNTWTPDNFLPLQIGGQGISAVDQGSTNSSGDEIYTGPWVGLDFFYAGEDAKYLWTNAEQTFPSAGGNTYYPSEMAIHMYDNATGVDDIIVSNIRGDTTADTIDYLTAPYPVGSNIKETDDWLAYPTIAQSTDPNQFSVFYQLFQGADSVYYNDTTEKLYASIYTQTTSDGGLTWSVPTPYLANTTPAGTYPKVDYRWPQVSDWNSLGSGGPNAMVMFAADTAAGLNDLSGVLDANGNYFYDQQVSFNGVNTPAALSANSTSYPNPFTASTTIDFTLPNASDVLLTVTDLLGRSVATLVNGPLGAGAHSVQFNGANLADGVYRYTLQADGVRTSGSMSLIR